MPQSIQEALLSVWRQTLVDGKKDVVLDGENYPVRTTPRHKLKQVDFRVAGKEYRALEQNPNTQSRWAALAREGKRVMQFLEAGRYVAVVVDGEIRTYGKKS